ncbi:hypothetical protein KI387_002704, partial [Taxus chinensis]
MDSEYQSVMKNNTWKLVDLPPGKKPIGCRWIFKTKYKLDGTIDKYKARLVAKGYAQQEDIDYEETFAPTAKIKKFRMMDCTPIATPMEARLQLSRSNPSPP